MRVSEKISPQPDEIGPYGADRAATESVWHFSGAGYPADSVFTHDRSLAFPIYHTTGFVDRLVAARF